MQLALARQESACAVRHGTRFPQCRSAFGTGQAMPAARREHHDDVVVDRQIGDVLAERFDDARRFVPLSHGHWPGTIAIDHRQIGMAQPSRANADQHFVAARTVQVQGLDP